MWGAPWITGGLQEEDLARHFFFLFLFSGAGRKTKKQAGSVKYDILLITCPPIGLTRRPEESVLIVNKN